MTLRACLLVVSLFCLASPATSGSAEAATASWAIEPSSFDFGFRQPDGGPSNPKTFVLRNTGETALTPGLVSVTGRGGAGFVLTSNACDHQLAPGEGCAIQVSFDPRHEGRKEGTLTVETSGSNIAPATARLLGSGGEPIVVVEPATVVFDQVTIPVMTLLPMGSGRTVTVRNTGTADLKIEFIGYKEADASPEWPNFVMPGSALGPGLCPLSTVPPGGSCQILLEFSPDTPGTYRATIEFEYTDDEEERPFSHTTIPLEGTAVAQAPLTPPSPQPSGPHAASLPRFSHEPPRRTASKTAAFVFAVDSSPLGVQCRSSAGRLFHACASPVRLRGLKPGRHFFSVRAIGSDGAPGPVATYHWRVLGPKPRRR